MVSLSTGNRTIAAIAAGGVAGALALTGCSSSASDASSSPSAGSSSSAGATASARPTPTAKITASGNTAASGAAAGVDTKNDFVMEPVADLCNGGTSVSPVNIYNATDEALTWSVTINPGLTYEAYFSTTAPTLTSGECTMDGWEAGTAESVAYQIPAGGSFGGYLVMGGMEKNIVGTSHSIAMGSGGDQWYDFNLKLNDNDNFESLTLDYDGTGGTGTNQSQSGFNVVSCDTSSGTPVPTSTILSPYSSGNTSPVTYGTNDPICFQFLPGAWGGGTASSPSAG